MADEINKNLGENKYNDINGNKNTYEESVAQAQNPNGIQEVNPETGETTTREATAQDAKLNTGSGVESAIGSDGNPIGYSWEQQGTKKAKNTYTQNVLEQKQNALTNRQTIENNAVNYQAQADMMKYQNNQNAEKVGWTGGYVLDQNRQSEYLKQSIQAQMYGAMELQKYGYDSSLAAARLSYDLNQQEYARQYYQEAVTAALSEAQLTGTYFSAETKDMMSQLAVARQKYDDANLSEEERDQADRLIKTIEGWFQSNGISQAGVKTLESWQAEQTQELQWSQDLYQRYYAAVQALKEDQQNNPSMFFRLDENGNPLFDGTDVKTIDFSATSIKDALSYVIQDGKITSEGAKQQLYSYFNWIMNDAIAKYKETVAKKDSDGNVFYNINKDDLQKTVENATKQIQEYTNNVDAGQLLKDYNFKSSDQSVNVSYDGNNITVEPTAQSGGQSFNYIGSSGEKYSVNTSYYHYAETAEVKNANTSKATDDDVEFNYNDKNYDLDIDWKFKASSAAVNNFSEWASKHGYKGKEQALWDDCQGYLNAYIQNPKNNYLVIGPANTLWLYYSGTWGYVQDNTGGSKLLSDIKSAIAGNTPDRWE